MRKTLLLNDIHLGVVRTGGTTLASAEAIREYLQDSLRNILAAHVDKDVVINGDLFDTFSVPLAEVLEAYVTFSTWLDATANEDYHSHDPRLILGKGNHDVSKDSSKMSSFAFLGELLVARYGAHRVVVVNEPTDLGDGLYMIPHTANQELFNLALEQVPAGAKMVLLHANLTNHFAVEAAHSLNVSEEQAGFLVKRGVKLVFGHEHQARHLGALGDKVNGRHADWQITVTGNQWPTSIADCLENPDDVKFAHVIDAAMTLTPILTWQADSDFVDCDWLMLDDVPATARFIRCSGTANAEQAADVVATISKFRQASKALVVTNAVKIEGVDDVAELATSAEDIKAFDVLAYLYTQVDEDQAAVIRGLLAKAA